MFPVRLFMDSGSYYFVTSESADITQCARNKPEIAVQMTTGTYTGVVQESLSVKVLDGGLVNFHCRTDEPNGPGHSYDILCSDTGIQIVPPDKGISRVCLEFPGTEATPNAAGYLGWLQTNQYSDCRDYGVAPQIAYTPLSTFPYPEPTLGSRPVTCVPADGGKTLSFKDLLDQPVSVTLDGGGAVTKVRWQGLGDR